MVGSGVQPHGHKSVSVPVERTHQLNGVKLRRGNANLAALPIPSHHPNALGDEGAGGEL